MRSCGIFIGENMQFKHSVMALGAIGTLMLFGGQSAGAVSADTEKKDKPSSSKTKEAKKIIVTVKAGDTLEAIAKKNKTTYVRLFNANKDIVNPDQIDVGEKVRVPATKEKLQDRFSKLSVAAAPTSQPVAASTYQQPAIQPSSIGSSASIGASSIGNTYYKGYCTWHVKNMRPDLPNMLGDGGSWVANAAAQGLATGSEPRVGAVAEQPGHVAYVTAVNKQNNTVTLSEMNYVGFDVISTRTAPASQFTYIY